MRKLTLKLSRSTIVRKAVKSLRLHLPANWWLRRFSVGKTYCRGSAFVIGREELKVLACPASCGNYWGLLVF
jgi:hypothetical protein